MSIQNELKAVFYFIPRLIKDFWEHERNFARQYANALAIVLLLILVSVGGYFGYRWYAVSREQSAQLALSSHMEELQRVATASKELMPVQLAQLDAALSFDYSRHKNSALAPMFLLLKADVQIKQNKLADAATTLEQVINRVPAHSPLLPLIKTKRALLQLDSDNEMIQQTGLQDLISLARDTENRQRDLALFYLGRYYWTQNKLDDAQVVWQELIDIPEYTGSFSSPWAYAAQEMLAQMNQ